MGQRSIRGHLRSQGQKGQKTSRIFISRPKQSRIFLFKQEQCILSVYMCIFFRRDQRSLKGSKGQFCQNLPKN